MEKTGPSNFPHVHIAEGFLRMSSMLASPLSCFSTWGRPRQGGERFRWIVFMSHISGHPSLQLSSDEGSPILGERRGLQESQI